MKEKRENAIDNEFTMVISKYMTKKVFFLLFLIAVLSTYFFRVELIRSGVNAVMLPFDVRLEQLQGLNLGVDQLSVKELIWSTGQNQNIFYISHIAIEFSLDKMEISGIEIQNIRLGALQSALKQTSTSTPIHQDSLESQNEPLLLSDLIDQLYNLPIDALTVHELEVVPFGTNHSLSWTKNGNSQHLQISEESKRLALDLDRQDGGKITAQLKVDHKVNPAVELEIQLQPVSEGFEIKAIGSMFVEQSLQLLEGFSALPGEISGVTGKLEVHVKSQLENDLNLLTNEPVRVSFVEPSNLYLAIKKSQLENILQEISPETIELMPINVDQLNIKTKFNSPEPLVFDFSESTELSFDTVSLEIGLESTTGNISLQAAMPKLECKVSISFICDAGFELYFVATEFKIQSYDVSRLESSITGKVHLSTGGLEIGIVPTSERILSIESTAIGDITVSDFSIDLIDALAFQYGFPSEQLKADAGKVVINILSIEGERLKIHNTTAQMRKFSLISDRALNMSFDFDVDPLDIQIPDQWMPKASIFSTFTMTKDKLTAKGQASLNNKNRLAEFSLEHSLINRGGKLKLQTDAIDFGTDNLSARFSHWPFKGDVISGAFFSQANISWFEREEELTVIGESMMRLEGLNGFYNDTVFAGLNMDISTKMNSLSHFQTKAPATFSLELFDVGLPFANISGAFTLNTLDEKFKLMSFKTELLGGELSVDEFNFSEKDSNLLNLNAEGLKIEQLVSIAAYESVQASGVISGNLPISITPDGISMENGRLAAEPPGGIIRYTPDSDLSLDQLNPNVQLVADALKNYHYHTMRATAEYGNDGDLLLSMKLQGISPDLNGGQQINLNLNVTDNIPTLLKSLQSSRVISEVFENALLK